MPDDNRMYELEYPSPDINSESNDGPTLIVALQGFADAGHAVDGAAKHLKAALESRPVVSFNNDELIDYRSRRPAVSMNHHHITDVEDLQLDIRVLRDNQGKSFLLLSGPEPDFRWESFTDAVADLVDKYDVAQVMCLYGAPMAVPHTRPLVISAHGNSVDLVGNLFTFDSRVTMPGSASLYIERELHKRGKAVAGYTAHVPHYLAQSPYPQATFQLLRSVGENTNLDFPLRSLERDMERAAEQIEDQTGTNMEVAQVVQALETQYDEEIENYRNAHPDKMLPGEASVPSGEEIGAEFEKFLATIDDQEGPTGSPRAIGGEPNSEENTENTENSESSESDGTTGAEDASEDDSDSDDSGQDSRSTE